MCGGEKTYLGAKAVAESTDVGETELGLHVLEGIDNDGVDGLLVMGVLAIAALGDPLHNVKASRHGDRKLVLVEEVNDQGGVAIGSELIGKQLGVAPDAKDVGNVEKTGVLVCLVGGSLGEVALIFAGDGDLLALRGASTLIGKRLARSLVLSNREIGVSYQPTDMP